MSPEDLPLTHSLFDFQRAVCDWPATGLEHSTDTQHLDTRTEDRGGSRSTVSPHQDTLALFTSPINTPSGAFIVLLLSCDSWACHTGGEYGHLPEESPTSIPFPVERVPLPDPRIQATQLLSKMTAHNDEENYLQMFESIAAREGWPQEAWARVLAPLLTGEPQQAYFSMPMGLVDSYDELRKEILARVGLSPIAAAQMFHDWEYNTRLPAHAQAAELSRLSHHWLLAGGPSTAQVAERVVVDRLLRALPRSLRQAAGMRNPHTIGDLVEAIELAEATQRREAGERAPPFPRRVHPERRKPEGISRPVGRSAVPGPQDEPMPTDPPRSPNRAWLAGCIVHHEPPLEAPWVEVKVNGRPYQTLLDWGSAVSLVQPTVFPPRGESKALLPITCVHGDTRRVPAWRITISAAPGSWSVEVGIVKDLPVPVLLGRDWPGFDRLLAAATQPVSPTGNRRRQKLNRGPRERPVLLASDSARDGESPFQTTNLFYDVFQQVTGGRAFAKEQLGDDRLKHCWTQVRVIEGKETQPPPHPVPHFVVQKGLLYCVAQRRGEEKKLLVMPRLKTETVMELAHSHPMAGHLGAQNTIQRIRDRFHWPGLVAEVKRFCQACPICQQTSPHTPPPSPLIPLPILEVPFERIGMDLVGPLPKSARGHEHILVIVDYATRYPEAIPLRKATSKAIAQGLFLLCSRVGIPTEILTDQGTPFMSRMMADLCRFLKVKQLRTTVYHPQTDGLVERINQTLKQMLRRADDKRDWDQMLLYVLFGIREVPPGFYRFHPLWALVWASASRPAWRRQGSLGTAAGSPSVNHRTRPWDEGADWQGHAVSPGAPHESPARPVTPLQQGSPATGVSTRRSHPGLSPDSRL